MSSAHRVSGRNFLNGRCQPWENAPVVSELRVHEVAAVDWTMESNPTRTPGSATTRPDRRTLMLHLAVFGGFVLLGIVLWWDVWITGHPTTSIACQCGDPSQELWFLTWTPWAIIHGHSPFLTNAMFAGQGGANMLVNTSWMAPGIVLAPITWLFGPIASFNVAAVLAPAISGWCFFVAARRVTTLVPAQVLTGLLFGFSPFVLENDPFGHINWTLLFFPPLAFILFHDLFVTHRRSSLRIGVLLAVLVIVEFFTSTEMLAIAGISMGVALVVAAALAPHEAWEQRGRALTAFGVAAGISAVILAYPVWFIVDGPRRVVGPPWPNPGQFGATPGAIVNAGLGVHASSYFDRISGYFGPIGPNAGPVQLPSLVYFGPLLVAFVVVSAVTWYRSRLAWTLAIATVIAWALSFGTTLGNEASPAGEAHAWWLPWRLFDHVPLVSSILPIRFGVMVIFGVAMLMVISLDRWAALISKAVARWRLRDVPDATWYRRPGVLAGAVSTLAGVIVLVPVGLTNSVPFTVVSSPMPAWFSNEATHLPAGTTVLVVPFAGQRAMGWQAQTGLRFDLAGGSAVVPAPDGRSASASAPTGAVAVLNKLSPRDILVAKPLPTSAASVKETRAAINRWHVGATVVTELGLHPAASATFFTAVYGRAPVFHHQVWAWSGPPSKEPPGLAPSTLSVCTSQLAGISEPLVGPACVLQAVGRADDGSSVSS